MEKRLPPSFQIGHDVAAALRNGQPVVALESTVITHGLPRPQNYNLAKSLEEIVRAEGAVPATVAVLAGRLSIGLTADQLEHLASQEKVKKISRKDIGIAVAEKADGGTTVAATLFLAHQVGIRVFATGGIGGVHRGNPFDISADLPELARTPMVVVCAGAKAILDLPATLETLETLGVPVIGYQTDRFPAFYSADSGLPVDHSVQTPGEAAQIARHAWQAGLNHAVLVVAPPPAHAALERSEVDGYINQALEEAEAQKINRASVTPFLLKRVSELSGKASLEANLALLKNNARLAAQIACALTAGQHDRII